MEVIKGYKQTEVGVIPEDWDVKTFDEVATVRKQRLAPQVVTTPLFCVELDNIEQGSGKLIGGSEITNIVSMKSVFHEGDVLFGKLRAYLRKYWFADRNGVCSTEIWPLVAAPNIATEKYLFQLVQTDEFIEVTTMAYGTHMPRTDWNIVKNYAFPLPPLHEQRAIAAALSDIDAVLTALDELIAKKRLIKQGAMQELLTGRKRLQGFSDEWEVKTIGTFADVKTGPFGSALHEKDYVPEGTPLITVEHLSEFGVVHSNMSMVSDFDVQRLKAYTLQTNDIVFSRVGAVDRNSLISKEEEGWLFSGSLLRLRIQKDNVFAPFISYLFYGEPFRRHVGSMAVGQTRLSLNTRIISNIPIAIPSLAEQTTIAKILSDLDAEITALEQNREKTRLLKQGMMQELLTGRIRLV